MVEKKKLWHRLKKLESEEMGYLDKLIAVLITNCNSIGRQTIVILFFDNVIYVLKFLCSQFLSKDLMILEKLLGIIATSGDPDQTVPSRFYYVRMALLGSGAP